VSAATRPEGGEMELTGKEKRAFEALTKADVSAADLRLGTPRDEYLRGEHLLLYYCPRHTFVADIEIVEHGGEYSAYCKVCGNYLAVMARDTRIHVREECAC